MNLPELVEIARALVVDPGVAPGASLALAERSGAGWTIRTGAAGQVFRGASAPVGPATPFDLASVTKPIVACAIARLVRGGTLELGRTLGSLLPEARGTPCEGTTLELLLAHRAGLDGHRALYRPLLGGRPFDAGTAIREACSARRADCVGEPGPDGFEPLYSDLGYLLVGLAAERAAGLELDALVEREVARPLGLELGSARQWLRRRPRFLTEVAATEVVGWRGGLVRGVVHDENAWALAGHGIAGQAGLFGTALAVARLGCALLDAQSGRSRSFLEPSELEPLLRPRRSGSLRAGFDGLCGPGSAAGPLAGEQTFGHLGFTGTSLWCDPGAEIVTVLLTNRVCPTRDHLAIRQARPRVQAALYQLAMAATQPSADPPRSG